jgi:putative heme iron utilization protein
MATVKNVAEAKAYFGLPQNAPVVEIELFDVVDHSIIEWENTTRLVHLSKQAC